MAGSSLHFLVPLLNEIHLATSSRRSLAFCSRGAGDQEEGCLLRCSPRQSLLYFLSVPGSPSPVPWCPVPPAAHGFASAPPRGQLVDGMAAGQAALRSYRIAVEKSARPSACPEAAHGGSTRSLLDLTPTALILRFLIQCDPRVCKLEQDWTPGNSIHLSPGVSPSFACRYPGAGFF